MKQHPPDSDIIELIVARLGPPRRRGAYAEVEAKIEMLRANAFRPFPDAASIRKIAGNLRKALEPLGDMQIPIWLKGCEGRPMTLLDVLSALDWCEHLEGPSQRFDRAKYLAALFADSLVNEFSQKPPTGTEGGQVRDIAGLLYSAISDANADELADLKHQTDAVRRSWSDLELSRGR